MKLVETLNTEKRWVRGVAELNNQIYAVLSDYNTIFVYARTDYIQQRNILVKGMQDPNDIAAFASAGHLYIADWGGQCLWKVETSGTEVSPERDDDNNGLKTVKFADKVDNPRSLSVNANGELLVIHAGSGEMTVFGSNGDQLIKIDSIPLTDKGYPKPWHCIQTGSNTFIVCHGRTDTPNRICEIDKNGELMREFGGRHGLGVGEFCSPAHLSHGAVNGSTFVVDDKRVLVLDERLRTKRVLLQRSPETDLLWTRLCYVKATGTLFVAWDKGCLYAYSMLQ